MEIGNNYLSRHAIVFKNREIVFSDFLVAVLLIIACLFIKPTFFGIQYTYFGLALSIFALLITGHFSFNSIKKDGVVFIILLTRMYFIVYQFLTSPDGIINQFKALFSILLFYIIFKSIFINKNIRNVFLKIFVDVMAFFSLSYIVTFLLSLFIGGYNSLVFVNYSIPDTDYVLTILFPFTPAHTAVRPIAGISFLRLHCMFRESGIAQLFFLWLIALMPTIYKKRDFVFRIKVLLLALGTFFCMSTTGVINLIAFLFIFIIINKKVKIKSKLIIIVLIAFLIFAITNIEGLRFEDINYFSREARIGGFNRIIDEWKENIMFGVGYNARYSYVTGLIQMLNRIGIVGFLLYLLPFFYLFFKAKSKSLYLLSITPCLVTIILSQPIIDAPIIYLLLLFYERKKKTSCLKTRQIF